MENGMRETLQSRGWVLGHLGGNLYQWAYSPKDDSEEWLAASRQDPFDALSEDEPVLIGLYREPTELAVMTIEVSFTEFLGKSADEWVRALRELERVSVV
jgi:hypothetical protein